MTLSPLRSGLAVGAALGLYHLTWAALVALGWAQALMDFILWIHFIRLPLEVQPFDPGLAAILVAVTGVLGFVFGYVFALIWNRLHRPNAPGSRQT